MAECGFELFSPRPGLSGFLVLWAYVVLLFIGFSDLGLLVSLLFLFLFIYLLYISVVFLSFHTQQWVLPRAVL